MSSNLSNYKPQFSDVIRSIIDSVLLDMYFCLPAKIVKYYPETQYADVQVQLLSKYTDGSTLALPVIPQVPVKHPRAQGGACYIHMPLTAGDDVTLVFSQRSLDNWKSQGGMTDPGDPRKSHITDAFALIGGSAKPDAFNVDDPTAIEITNGDSMIQVFQDGKFAIKNGTAELVTQVQLLAQTLSEDTTNTIFGPMPLNDFETYAEIATKIQTMVEG